MRWRFSNLISLRDRQELIIRLDKVHYFTRGSKVSLRKTGPETAKISRNMHPNEAPGSPSLSRTNCNSRSNLPIDTVAPWLASEPHSTGDAPLAHTCTRCAYVCIVHTVHCNIHTVLCAAYSYSDKLPMKITCNCWNNSVWNHLSAKPGKEMSLEFPGIISLQIQVTTKDFESWIHYWPIPLTC